MTILPLDPTANAHPAALRGFLGECAAATAPTGRPRLVSISVRVAALDPLAVLESIFEPGQPHFYAERPDLESALAGAEVAAEFTAHGPGRFAAVQAWVDATLADAIAVGEVNAPFGGPHFFAAFSFLDDVEPGEPFPAAQVFVPRWQVARAGDATIAVANLLVGPGADLDALAERVWRAHAKFRSFEFGPPPGGGAAAPRGAPLPGAVSRATVGPDDSDRYRAAVEQALALIGAGGFRKIVLARAVDVVAREPLHPLELLNGLRQRFPSCYAFSLANGRGQSFIGASPERLVRVSQGLLETEALAGSIRRGAGAREDAGLAHELAHNDKEQLEHRLVLEAVTARLAALGLTPEFPAAPGLRRLANVQHLHTPVRAALGDKVRLLDAVAALHPTPATGGWPVAAAVGHIRRLEGFPRGLYAGALGWLNARGGGEFFVGLRSALVDGRHASLYAGAGIVAGSTPHRELAETELKFRAMLDALLG
jgi:menaquinone-specific isochorismate synthase